MGTNGGLQYPIINMISYMTRSFALHCSLSLRHHVTVRSDDKQQAPPALADSLLTGKKLHVEQFETIIHHLSLEEAFTNDT